MNTLRIAPRCLSRPANSLSPATRAQITLHNTPLLNPTTAVSQQVRHRSWFGWGSRKDEDMQKPASESRSLKELLKASPKTTNTVVPQLERGGLAKSNIFGDDEAPAGEEKARTQTLTDKEYISIVDPARQYSWSWPRRFEARQHHRRGRLTKKMQIMQTEKSHLLKSDFIKTSVKKLAPLARQIAGMSVDDAIVQMRFSPKKASAELLAHLTTARTEAILTKDMNPSEMYVDQAWVGRGSYERELSHRARGRIDMLRKPSTSVTVVLKEEATRRRIAKEAEEKEARKKIWVQLPNKPIPGQRQYYQW